MSLVDTVKALFGAYGPEAAEQAAATGLSDDVVMIEGGRNLRSGEHRGKEAMFAMLSNVQTVTDHFRSDMIWARGDDELVISLAHAVGERNGRSIDTYILTLIAPSPDGKIAEIRDLPFDWTAWEEFFAE